MMLQHGLSPDGMLFGTMVPIPKGQWANLSNSDNLCSSNLQFNFKPGDSTSLCTCMVHESIYYYVNNGSNVYGLMLDACKHLTVLITVSYLKFC